MKAAIIREDIEVDILMLPVDRHNDRTMKVNNRYYWKKGAIIDDPAVYKLVMLGVAESHDEECKAKVNLLTTSNQIFDARIKQEMLSRGLSIQHYNAYAANVITSRDNVGFTPGVNLNTYKDFKECFTAQELRELQELYDQQ